MLLIVPAAYPQSLDLGLKGGVPLVNVLNVNDSSTFHSDRPSFVIGPMAELGLPLGLGVEVDFLYRRVQYSSSTLTPPTLSRTTGQSWEFPFLAKYRLPGVLVRPFVVAGLSFRRLAAFDQSTVSSSGSASTDQPPEVKGRSAAGPTLGAGLQLSLPLVRLSSEVRYTRWATRGIQAAFGGLTTQLNQADFLLGVSF